MDTITKCVQIELGQRIGPCNDDKDDSAHYPFQIIRPIDFEGNWSWVLLYHSRRGTGCKIELNEVGISIG